MEGVKPAARWLRSYWDEEDILFFFEADEDGVVLRQVEFQGPTRTPIAASALSEIPDVQTAGLEAVGDYETRYGMPADQPITSWDPGFPHDDISVEEFEGAWRIARTHLDENR